MATARFKPTSTKAGVPWPSANFKVKTFVALQIHHTDKISQHSSIVWQVWLNGWFFVYKVSSCGFQSHNKEDLVVKELSHTIHIFDTNISGGSIICFLKKANDNLTISGW